MTLSKLCIERPAATGILAIAVIVFGLITAFQLPISDLPNVQVPTVEVSTTYPGYDAQDMAEYIALPLETEFMGIPGLKNMQSMNIQGKTTNVLSFDLDKSIASAEADTQKSISAALPLLPPDMPSMPIYKVFNPSDSPIMYLAVNSQTVNLGDLYNYASTLVADSINTQQGVGNLEYFGSPQAIHIKLNPSSLAQRNLNIIDVKDKLTQASTHLPSGYIFSKSSRMQLSSKGQISKAEDYLDVVVGEENGRPVFLKDVGIAYRGLQNENLWNQNWSRKTGVVNSVVLAIDKQPGANTLQILEDIKALMPAIEASLPKAVSLQVIWDAHEEIMSSVNDVIVTLSIAFILVILVVYFFLGRLSATLIPIVSLPFSIIGSAIFLYLLGFSINILTLLGYVLIIGFLVDDAIVMLENIFRHLEKGKSSYQAAIDGSKEVIPTIISMSSSLIAVFLPMALLPGVIGKTFLEFAVIVILTVGLSGLVTLTLVPMLCSRYLKNEGKSKVEEFSKSLLTKMRSVYVPILDYALHHRIKVVLLGVLAFVVSIFLYQMMPKDFIPKGNMGGTIGIGIADPGASPEKMVKLQEGLNDIIKKVDHVDLVISGVSMPMLPSNETIFFAKFSENGPSTSAMIEILKEKTAGYIGMLPIFTEPPLIKLSSSPNEQQGDYEYIVRTISDPAKLYEACDKMIAELKITPEVTQVSSNVQTNQPQMDIKINRKLAGVYGITAEEIQETMNLAFSVADINTYNTSSNLHYVYLSVQDEFRQYEDDISKIYIKSSRLGDDGKHQMVPLSTFVEAVPIIGPNAVYHYGKLTSLTISFDLAKGASLSSAEDKINALSDKYLSTGSFIAGFEGQALIFNETINSLILLLLMAIFIVYVILTILYESFVHPITILSTLPGVTLGAFLTLFIFRETMSLYGYIGLFVIIGIVLKNGIIIVDFANKHVHSDGLSPIDAVARACKERFRPIMMTSIAAGMGAVPIAIGIGGNASVMRPLGLAIVGGLCVSQIVTLFLTPCVYVYLEEIQEWWRNRKRRSTSS